MKTAKHSTSKEEIVKKAAKLFAQKGYFGISMRDIAGKLKLTKAALYYYFPSKEKLYQRVLETTFLDLGCELKKSFMEGKTPWDKLLSCIETYLLFSLNRPEINLFFQEDASSGDRKIKKIVDSIRYELLNFFKQIIKTEAKGRQLASNQVLFLARLLLTILGKTIFIATFPPRFVAKQISVILFPEEKNKSISNHRNSTKLLLNNN